MFAVGKDRLGALGTAAVVAIGLGVLVAGCSSSGPALSASQITTPIPTATTTATSSDCTPSASYDPAGFPARPKIDNALLPLLPGTKYVLSGTVRDEQGDSHAHEIVGIVSDVTKLLNGVRSTVLFERDYQDGKLQESELAFEAQDGSGTVWNVGEYPEEYEDGELAGAPSTWITGIAAAQAGVNMPADPRAGTPAYLQGIAPSVRFRDCALVTKASQRVCIALQCYTGVMVSDEWAPLEPDGGHQLKYYAPGVGTVQVAAVGGANPEVLQLKTRSTLGRAELDRVNSDVLAQDARGYRVSPKVYALTARATLT
jgi:hypothetical protein